MFQQADLIIGLGTRYTDFTTCSKTQFKKAKRFVNVNLSRMQAYKFDAVSVVSDVKNIYLLYMIYWEIIKLLIQMSKLHLIRKEWEEERKRLSQLKFTTSDFTPEIDGHFTQEILNEYAQVWKQH